MSVVFTFINIYFVIIMNLNCISIFCYFSIVGNSDGEVDSDKEDEDKNEESKPSIKESSELNNSKGNLIRFYENEICCIEVLQWFLKLINLVLKEHLF